MARASSTQAFTSGTTAIDALIGDVSWTGTTRQAATIGYSFGVSYEGGALFDATARTAALSAMQAWANVANITFSSVSSASAALTFSKENLGSAVAGLTTTYYSSATLESAEVQIHRDYSNFPAGGFNYSVLVHELGHALGLKHPGSYGAGDVGPYLSSAEDNYNATVMSYNPATYVNDSTSPVGPMIYDVAAIQYLYGANTSYNSGNSTYSFSGSFTAYAIWDGGGTDMISAANYASGATINLRENLNSETTIGSAHLWMAVGANIENAEGGAGSDALTGNALANTLYGRGGSDTLLGGDNNDTLCGGTGIVDPSDAADSLMGGAGSDMIYGNGGADTIMGGSAVADPSDSADTIYGGGASDMIYGNGGNDSICGGGSSVDPNDTADTVYGGGGSDTILGNGGADSLCGGGASVDPNDIADLIYGGRGGDYILGNGGADTLIGGEDNDTMHGGTGNDTYRFGSGEGDDTILQFENAGSASGDVIALTSGINGLSITATSDVLSHISYSGGNAIIDLGSGYSITIESVSAGALVAADFVIV